jgi:hypothetical protein
MPQAAFLRLADRLTLIYAAMFFCTVLVLTFITDGVVLTEKGVVGGDFLAFYTAGGFARAGDALTAYDFAAFDAKMKELAPLDQLGMMWQYPPTVFFLTAPFAFLPYKISFVVWCLLGWAALFAALRTLGFRGWALRLLAFSALCVNVIDNGQISLATTALLFLAAYDPKRRWLTAGLAAGLLTIKPQLGLLLPIAFMAAGAWRTIAVAAVAAIVLHAPSLLVWGVEGWRDFFSAVIRLNADVTGPGQHTPPLGMTTLFGQLRALGVPSAIASPAQYVVAGLIAVAVAVIWRRPGDVLGKAGLVCAGAILATPYAYSYEMPALLLAAAFLARQNGGEWSAETRYLAGAGALYVLAPVLPTTFGLQLAFLISASAFGFVLARMAGGSQRGLAPSRALRA